jgi:hypothetical protein
MKKILFFLFVILVGLSCKKTTHLKNNISNNSSIVQNNSNTNNNKNNNIFDTKISNNTINLTKAFYEKTDNATIITLWNNDGNKLFIYSSNDNPTKLDNRSFFVNKSGTYYIKQGNIKFSVNNNTLEGIVSFKAKTKDSDSIEISKLKFDNIQAAGKLSNKNIFTTTKTALINTQKGQITEKNINYKITIDKNKINFENTDNLSKSITYDIEKKIQKATSDIIYTSENKIKYIFIDKMKNQITIFYTNGNNLTFM